MSLNQYKVFIQVSSLACEVYVAVSLLCSLPTIVCVAADSVVYQVALLILSFETPLERPFLLTFWSLLHSGETRKIKRSKKEKNTINIKHF